MSGSPELASVGAAVGSTVFVGGTAVGTGVWVGGITVGGVVEVGGTGVGDGAWVGGTTVGGFVWVGRRMVGEAGIFVAGRVVGVEAACRVQAESINARTSKKLMVRRLNIGFPSVVYDWFVWQIEKRVVFSPHTLYDV